MDWKQETASWKELTSRIKCKIECKYWQDSGQSCLCTMSRRTALSKPIVPDVNWYPAKKKWFRVQSVWHIATSSTWSLRVTPNGLTSKDWEIHNKGNRSTFSLYVLEKSSKWFHFQHTANNRLGNATVPKNVGKLLKYCDFFNTLLMSPLIHSNLLGSWAGSKN